MKNINKKLYIIDKSYLNEDWQSLIDDMPLWRQEATKKFAVNEPKKLSLLASILYERMMREIGVYEDIKNIKVSYNQYGKPFIEEEKYKDIKFNISHTKDKVILSVSDEEVGCDIEKIRDLDINIAKRFFTENEYRYIYDIKNIDIQKAVFYKIWTMKESIAKYIGKGLSMGLDSVDINDIDIRDLLDNKEKQKTITFFNNGSIFYFHNFDMKDYMTTICTKSDKKFSVVKIL
ncbi:MAG: 4'-phosphopantetheinyl transferase superfamily protein [Lachnospiraceae bacterium]|nr:4'-phosphopantetheinyl transferase superfamily protein [Lachnospiraceae bacterium]